ncbi:MAG: TonB-dependent receptor [Lutibacter sp.]|nr:TonB-dependent receptor [Lutibacter sp.]
MRKNIFSLYFMLFALVVFSQEIGSISGTVIDKETGKTIPNAEILIVEITQGVVVSENGTFEIKNVKPGTYTLSAHALGFITNTHKNIRVYAGENKNIHFSMEPENIALEEVTVSATKINKTIDKIGSPVYVINRKEIERTEGRNIEEVLIRVPGVFTEDRYHNETNLVSFRGVGLHTHVTRGILVLVDGVSLTEAMGRTDFEGVDMENAEKVEILKGPVSALYGPNGITGVINIVEKSPKEGFHGKAKASYGSYNSMTLSGDVNGGKDGFRYLVKGKYFNTDGYLDRSESSSSRFGVKLVQRFNNAGKLQFTTDYISSEMDIPGTLTQEQFDDRSTFASNLFADYNRDVIRTNFVYTQNLNNKIDLYGNLYYRNNNSDGFYADYSYSEDDINSIGGELRSQFKNTVFGKENSIIVGVSMLNEKGVNETFRRDTKTGSVGMKTNDGESIYNMFGAFIEDEFMLTSKLGITLGLRYDLVDYDWTDSLHEGEENTTATTSISSFSPKFGFAYNPTKNTTVFGNIARGFNPPQISQLFVGSSYSGLANPDLKPEYITNYELGIRANIKQKFMVQASFFMMDFTDQITTEIIPEIDPDNPVYQNVGKTKHTGLETSLEYHFTNKFNIYTNYSYLDARFNDDPDYGDNTLRKTPHNMMNAGLRYEFKFGLITALDYKFVDKFYMDNEEVNEYEGYSLLNIKLMYNWKGFMISAAVNNVLDTNYATYAYSSESYNPITHQTSWETKYIPGWPVNINTAISYRF